MRLKSLTLQMLPWWCFHVLGVSTSSIPGRTGPVRLIGSDGRVRVYCRPVYAAELMAEHPRHLICRSDSFYIGRKVPALSASEELQPGNSYFLLPTHFFHSVLSFVTVATSLAATGGCAARLFDIHKTAAGTLQIRVSDEFIEAAESDGASKVKESRVCTTAALEKDYRQLVRCKLRQWKPELETIREFERRRSSWGRTGGVFDRFKRRKNLSLQPFSKDCWRQKMLSTIWCGQQGGGNRCLTGGAPVEELHLDTMTAQMAPNANGRTFNIPPCKQTEQRSICTAVVRIFWNPTISEYQNRLGGGQR